MYSVTVVETPGLTLKTSNRETESSNLEYFTAWRGIVLEDDAAEKSDLQFFYVM